jgi:hypothetical protein
VPQERLHQQHSRQASHQSSSGKPVALGPDVNNLAVGQAAMEHIAEGLGCAIGDALAVYSTREALPSDTDFVNELRKALVEPMKKVSRQRTVANGGLCCCLFAHARPSRTRWLTTTCACAVDSAI